LHVHVHVHLPLAFARIERSAVPLELPEDTYDRRYKTYHAKFQLHLQERRAEMTFTAAL
jgi:hypothetical protein